VCIRGDVSGQIAVVAEQIAFLGTGIMGLPMARNLVRAGLDVRAWNRTTDKARPLADDGATVCDSAAEAVRGAGVVITMLTDADAVAAAMEDAVEALEQDAVWVQMSTVGIQGCAQLADLARRHGITFVDAPVLGTKKPAEDGQLKIFVAGPPELRPRLEPVLRPMGSIAQWFEEVGKGSALKMVLNAWVLALTDATATSLALARALDLDPQLFLDTIDGGPSDSPYAHTKGAMMIKGEYPPSFGLSSALKDAGLILDAAGGAGLQAGLMAAVRDHLRAAQDAGYGEQDMSAIFEAHRADSAQTGHTGTDASPL
jgi:3-hydroxyisobutyrate dehydrogenase